MPVPTTAATTSCSTPRRCRSPTPWGRRSIRWPCADRPIGRPRSDGPPDSGPTRRPRPGPRPHLGRCGPTPRHRPPPARSAAAASGPGPWLRPVLAAGHRPVQQAGLAVDQRGRADAPELEAVAVTGHLGQHGDERARRGHRIGAGRGARPSAWVAMTRASVTVTALSARTRRPWKRRSPSTVVSSTTRKTARFRSQ